MILEGGGGAARLAIDLFDVDRRRHSRIDGELMGADQ